MYAIALVNFSKYNKVFVEHSDYTKYVEIKDDSKFMDVNFPSDVVKVSKKNKWAKA